MSDITRNDRSIEIIADALRAAPQVRGLFLSGSHATGHADAWSDLDFVLVTPDGASDEIAKLWRDAVAQTGEIVLWWDRNTRPMLINAITADWTRLDLVILKPAQTGAQTRRGLTPLFDHDGLYDTLNMGTGIAPANPARHAYCIAEFLRILGLLHLVVGRGEWHNGVLGVFHLRNLLVELMVAQTAVPDRGGMLHLNRLITDEQRAVLDSLPAAKPNRNALIDAHLAYAKAYLPRARTLAEAWDVPWPARFEEVTWEKLAATLKVARPY